MKCKSIDVKCDFVVSRYCKIYYTMCERAYETNLSNNNQKFRCKMCAIEQTHSGAKSHYFKYEKKEDYFECIDNDTKAYLLGVIAGDGHIDKKAVSIVANKKDVETLNLFLREICKNEAPPLYKKGKTNCLATSLTSYKLVNDVCHYLKVKPGKKSHLITLPDFNDTQMWSFIRGLFDTDGSVGNFYAKLKSPSCFCSSTSKIILKQIQVFCEKYEIKSDINGIKVRFNGLNAIQFMQKLYDNEFVALSRKKEMFLLWKNWKPKLPGPRRHPGRYFSDEQILNIRQELEQYRLNPVPGGFVNLASKYKISKTTLKDIEQRKTYKDIK